MGRETHLIPIIWEEQISHWEQVSETKWEPRYVDFPVAAPLTGKVERINPLPFEDKNQFYNNDFIENFDANELSPIGYIEESLCQIPTRYHQTKVV